MNMKKTFGVKKLIVLVFSLALAVVLAACGGTGSPANGTTSQVDVPIPREGIVNLGAAGTATVSGTFTEAGLQTAINNIQTAVAEMFASLPPFMVDDSVAAYSALNIINKDDD